MAWTIELTQAAKRNLRKLDGAAARRVTTFLRERIGDEPRSVGEPLRGPLSGYWNYRVGDFRIVCDIQDRKLVVLVVEIGNRREIYR